MSAMRTVYVRLEADSASAVGRAGVARELGAALGSQVGAATGLERVRVLRPADAAAERSWDLCVLLEFADAASCARETEAGGRVDAVLDAQLGARAVVVKAWSFVD